MQIKIIPDILPVHVNPDFAPAGVVGVHQVGNIFQDAVKGGSASGQKPPGVVDLAGSVQGDLDVGDFQVIEPGDLVLVQQIPVGDQSGIIKVEIQGLEFPGQLTDGLEGQQRLAAVPANVKIFDIFVLLDPVQKALLRLLAHGFDVRLTGLKAVGAAEVAAQGGTNGQPQARGIKTGCLAPMLLGQKLLFLFTGLDQDQLFTQQPIKVTVIQHD